MANVTTNLKQAPSRGSNLHLATAAPVAGRLDFKQLNNESGGSRPGHHRSASRDSIGHLGTFLMESEAADFDGITDATGPGDETGPAAVVGGEGVNRGGTLQRKQHCSSLINTPSGISVMEEMHVPHRLPLPIAPPSLPVGFSVKDESGGPKWTRNCAALLNYHK